MMLDTVTVNRRFARSARLDGDIGRVEAIEGYVLQPSVRQALVTMAHAARHSRQGAFTWTGPYGGGKSSAALVLAALLGLDSEARSTACRLVDAATVDELTRAFRRSDRGWKVVALSGRRQALTEDLATAIGAPAPELLAAVERQLAAASHDGVLVLIDELGKYLEHAALADGDVHVLQDLAELAARSEGRLLIVGILHQSFERYAARLSRMARDEWAKIQGRFQDIPLASANEETLDLISRAISVPTPPGAAAALAARVASEVRARRGSAPVTLAETLEHCWPLHPVVALLLGQLARHRFGQNERSVFGFLGSSEPHGFQDFLRVEGRSRSALYGPAELFDYLVANLGPAILASSEGHRFSTSVDAVDRAAARGGPLHVALTKAAAVIEQFGAGTGLVGSAAILSACAPGASERDVAGALQDLSDWSVLVYRRHADAYVVFAGSDFDLEAAVSAQRSESGRLDLSDRLAMPAIVAKRHYYRTGTLRWSDIAVYPLPNLELTVEASRGDRRAAFAAMHRRAFHAWRGDRRSAAALVLAVKPPEMTDGDAEIVAAALSSREDGAAVAAGLPPSSYMLRELASELDALERVARDNPQLEGDAIARREVSARLSEVASALEQEVRRGFAQARWFSQGARERRYDGMPLSMVASEEAESIYPATPLIRNELLNRERPSSNAMAALRALMHAMAQRRDEARLGLLGFPPEAALYASILADPGLHRADQLGRFGFQAPDQSDTGRSFLHAWEAAGDLAEDASVAEIYATWRTAPIGMRAGVMPLLAFAWILANEAAIAVYVDGVFTSVIDDVVADRLLQSPEAVRVRRVELGREEDAFLVGAAKILAARGIEADANPLPIARGLVRVAAELPKWAQRTRSLPEPVRRVRDLLLHADDPVRLLFEDLAFLAKRPRDRVELLDDYLAEAGAAYPAMLDGLRHALAAGLGTSAHSFEGLRRRAAGVQGVTGDLRLDAFALRVADFENADDLRPMIEGLGSFLVHKPAQQWADQDVDKAHAELVRFCRQLREAEAIAVVRGRATGAEAISVVVAGIGGEPIVRRFEVSGAEAAQARAVADELVERISRVDRHLQWAALAEALRRLDIDRPAEREAN